ncbi:MAG TPA: hypothetical protein DEA26_03185 [Oceanospirillales bacterium]|nr:hypothetical protein [Oceanospirillaceae bacterium]HBS41658.1 hypothetical protein [Oceanospirillales bacterium]|tara:strand:- start:496 stop:1053 length:558 start_codon:yes stop_codon:yes gene_type:complete
MSENNTPEFLRDVSELLTEQGLTTGEHWYHGTASGLLKSIMSQGLIGGGDAESAARMQKTLGTIGNRQFESDDPLFLTQSKELAYFWAEAKTHARNLYFQQNEEPVVLEISVAAEKVRPDVGAAALIMEPSNEYLLKLKSLYEAQGVTFEEVNPLKADRGYFLSKLGMAYTEMVISPDDLRVLEP